MKRTLSRRVRMVVAAVGALALAGASPAAMASPTPEKLQAVESAEARPTKAGTYIVQLAEPPVVAYTGGVAGIKATKPAKGAKVNPKAANVVRYVDHLARKQDAALAKAGGGKKLYSYAFTFNGFAAELSGKAAAKLATTPGVLAVTADEKRVGDTSSTPDFLGLTDEGGLWSKLTVGTPGKKGSGPGENMIVGIVDSGIWPEHPSFAARDAKGKLQYQQIPGWNGRCMPGEQFNASLCNGKIIGAQYFNAAWGGNAGIDEAFDSAEFNSARDFGGHGTHTASTAAGNSGVQATGDAKPFGKISGIAPRARIAAYKALWGTDGGSGFTTDLVAAIDQAVADGVDVINYSVSGSRTNFRDPVEIAFLYAADAGIFVAASAGNSGPTTSTVAHNSPWLTTVAAGTHNRDGKGSVTLGNGTTYHGASVATPVGPEPLIDATAAGLSGADPDDLALCVSSADEGYGDVLDPAKVSGKIVVCDRGVTGRVNKSLAVKNAGGVGMILVNPTPNSINADFHFVPTVHLQNTDRDAVKDYAATAGATATINASTIVYDADAPFTATFSSRGPALAGGGDLLKPDLIAPGQDILAAVAPPGNSGRLFDLYSGTSMSSPHVAGLAALLKQKYPTWSPMAIKSALMTTGYDVKDGLNTNPLVIFRQGAGHVAPNKAVDPGLVFDAGWDEWFSFICATEPAGIESLCASYPKVDASDYNSPSIAIGDLAGTQTVKRTVTNVSGRAATYNPAVAGLTGFDVEVLPDKLTLAKGAKGEFTVKITRKTAALNAYTGGQLTWSGGGKDVRIPVVVRPVALAAPAEKSGTGSPISYDVAFGYTGDFSAEARGLVPAEVTEGTVTQDPDQTFDPSDKTGMVAIPVTIPAGTTHQRYALFDADVSPGSDLDLYVYQGSTLVGSSGAGGSDEQVNFSFANPSTAPIDLTVYVHGWGVAGDSSPFKLHDWSVPATNAGNMTVTAPAAATLGEAGQVTLEFSGLAEGEKYLGSVAYGGVAGMPSPTIVSVNP